MKTAFILATVAASATAFAPSSLRAVKTSSLSMSDAKSDFPTINGWTADPKAFCAGLPGSVAPMGEYDPAGFMDSMSVNEIKRFRESEVTHGRVGMLAVVGYLVGEKFPLFFNGQITGPANTHLTQVKEVAPLFFLFLGGAIAAAEINRATTGWKFPGKENFTLKEKYYPGDIGFDPLGLKPTDPEEFADVQTKELNNGRLAMLAAIGMIGQELVTQKTLF